MLTLLVLEDDWILVFDEMFVLHFSYIYKPAAAPRKTSIPSVAIPAN